MSKTKDIKNHEVYDARSSFGCPDSVCRTWIYSNMAVVYGHWEALDVVSGCGTDWAAHGDTDNTGKKQWKRVEMVS